MRFVLPALILGIALPALAHAASCERPARPAFPDPKTASAEAVRALDQEMQKYAAGTNAYVQCLSKAAQEAQAEGTATINAYNQQFLAEYNKRAAGK